MRLTLSACVTLAALAIPAVAHADPLSDFSVSGHGLSLSFSLPTNPTPDGRAPHQYFFIGDVSFVEDGVSMVADNAYFYTKPDGGGFDLEDSFGNVIDNLDFLGPRLFTGPVRNPTFKSGDFTLRRDDCNVGSDAVTSDDSSCLHKYQLSITSENAATPEPGSFLLLGTGALGAVGALRRRLFA